MPLPPSHRKPLLPSPRLPNWTRKPLPLQAPRRLRLPERISFHCRPNPARPKRQWFRIPKFQKPPNPPRANRSLIARAIADSAHLFRELVQVASAHEAGDLAASHHLRAIADTGDSTLAAFGTPPASTGPSAQEIERKLKARYQEVRIQVEKDPAVRSLMEQSKTAKTFEDERAALREYYRLLFKKIRKVDKALTDRCDRLEQAYLARLAHTRIEPTIPLNPPPTPAPLSE